MTDEVVTRGGRFIQSDNRWWRNVNQPSERELLRPCWGERRRPCNVGLIMDDTRPMDNMALAWNTPQEDEVAVNQLSSGVGDVCSSHVSHVSHVSHASRLSHLCAFVCICVRLCLFVSFTFRLLRVKRRSTDGDGYAVVHSGGKSHR